MDLYDPRLVGWYVGISVIISRKRAGSYTSMHLSEDLSGLLATFMILLAEVLTKINDNRDKKGETKTLTENKE